MRCRTNDPSPSALVAVEVDSGFALFVSSQPTEGLVSKPLLLLLHGVGDHGADWQRPVLDVLEETAATFPRIASRGSLRSQVEVVALRYDDVFDDWLNRWEAQGSKVAAFMKASQVKMPRLAASLHDLLLPDDERGFFWSHAFDAIAYRGVSVIRDQVRSSVITGLIAAINEHLSHHPGADITILAHSLGTIVIHDVLAELATGSQGVAFKADRFRFSNLFLLANAVSLGPARLVDPRPQSSAVRPLSAGQADGTAPYLSYYYAFRHDWDPVASWQPFAPKAWGSGHTDVRLRHVHQANVHGYTHYLRHPEVHVRLLRALLGWDVITDIEWHDRVASFPLIASRGCDHAIATLLQRFDALRQVPTSRGLDEVAMGLFNFYRAVREARQHCEALFDANDGWL